MKVSFIAKEITNKKQTLCAHCNREVASMSLKLTGKGKQKVCEDCFIDLLQHIVILSK